MSILRLFPRSFWMANVMEIFERMGWYGFYAVSSLYLTGAIADGGLGFSSEDRGVIQGLATFFLYLFPAVFGALADRYDALVMVDDSHAVGFLGRTGRGTPEHCDVMGRVDILTGTLGKALGGDGPRPLTRVLDDVVRSGVPRQKRRWIPKHLMKRD